MYDIIGDVHGYASLLKRLLKKLGYSKTDGGYSHPTRKAIFVGDFINRGPEIRETIRIIRSMSESGNAVVILGNHELNAIIYYLKDDNGDRIIQKNVTGFYKTQQDFRRFEDEWKSHRKWFRTLPMFFENSAIRVVHAYWNDENIRIIKNLPFEGKWKKASLLNILINSESTEAKSIWQTTKGMYLELPQDLILRNNNRAAIRSFRLNWWEPIDGKTFNAASFESKFLLPEYTIPQEILPKVKPYPDNAPIVFFGHYCRGNGPWIIKDNVCCVDSCVTSTGMLAAYVWDGEQKLNPEHLVTIN
jgi:hypothetical protein